ncbi:hypothetical protein [Argonema galeatum]|uniref:hypothetical protein n=1 Tax=Argonema galeatum TaxID=2942762 RepID=UPI002012725F|nr:hypothetical protein [Argonema galeatum]MCL1465696.1 hypothetical protein [Argonema galeatum A003/A1]
MDEEKIKKSENSQTGLDKTLQVLGVVSGIVVTIIKWCFIATMFTLGTIFWLLDLWLGDGRNPISAPWDKPRRRHHFDQNQFRRELQKSTVEDILKEFGDQFDKIEKRDQLEDKEKKVVRKLRGLDRSKLRSQMRDALSDDEIEILFLILLKLLSGELR